MASTRKKAVEPGVPRCPGDKHTVVWVRRNGGGPDQLTCCPHCLGGPREAGGIVRLMTVTKHEDGTEPAAAARGSARPRRRGKANRVLPSQ
jgi:hypothetical protein